MALDEAARRRIWAKFQEIQSEAGVAIPVVKSNLRLIVDAVGSWIEGRITDRRQALPDQLRAALTDEDLDLLERLVAEERRPIGRSPAEGRGA